VFRGTKLLHVSLWCLESRPGFSGARSMGARRPKGPDRGFGGFWGFWGQGNENEMKVEICPNWSKTRREWIWDDIRRCKGRRKG